MDNIILQKAVLKDMPQLIFIEKTVTNLKTYSAMLTEDEWRNELTQNTVYIIKKGEDITGNISYEMKDANHAYISGLVVMPKFQGQGIAKEALVKVLQELKDIKTIDLVTHPENTPAIMLYLSLGFVIKSWKDNYYGDGEPRIILIKTR
jgi:ribosomal protein S18 acetylase RimI-like enzyme